MIAGYLLGLLMQAPAATADDIPKPQPKPAQTQETPKSQSLFNFLKTDSKTNEAGAIDIPVPDKKPAAAKTDIPLYKPYTPSSSPLGKEQSALYNEIFLLQGAGKMRQAAEKIAQLEDHRLYGHVLYQRYMHPKYTTSFEELETWLVHYGDHPLAYKIYTLALRKKPAGFKGEVKKPTNRVHIIRRHEPTMVTARRYQAKRKRGNDQIAQINTLNRDIAVLIRKDSPSQALKKLQTPENKALLDNVEYDTILANIAASYLYNGKVKTARTVASKSANRSGLYVPKAGWVAGLSSWMDKDYDAAARYFEIVGRSNYANSWTKAAGSYWAARAHMRTGNVKMVSTWLNRALEYPRTFYGLLATRALGRDFDFNWDVPTFTRENFNLLASTPAGFRALALVEIGNSALAEAELVRMNLEDPKLREAMLAYAGYARLPGLAMRIGANVPGENGESYYDAALYPMGPWQPGEGYKVDSALIHAIMRQESRFDPMAESAAGAKGLMQLMPGTARALAADKADTLDDPQTNLELGQEYLAKLLQIKAVSNDLVRLLIAYNAGPGNLQKWAKRFPKVDDPLLFVELVPIAETRDYVEKVLSNYWIYRLRDGLPTPTLDAVTAGKPADYAEAELTSTLRK